MISDLVNELVKLHANMGLNNSTSAIKNLVKGKFEGQPATNGCLTCGKKFKSSRKLVDHLRNTSGHRIGLQGLKKAYDKFKEREMQSRSISQCNDKAVIRKWKEFQIKRALLVTLTGNSRGWNYSDDEDEDDGRAKPSRASANDGAPNKTKNSRNRRNRNKKKSQQQQHPVVTLPKPSR